LANTYLFDAPQFFPICSSSTMARLRPRLLYFPGPFGLFFPPPGRTPDPPFVKTDLVATKINQADFSAWLSIPIFVRLGPGLQVLRISTMLLFRPFHSVLFVDPPFFSKFFQRHPHAPTHQSSIPAVSRFVAGGLCSLHYPPPQNGISFPQIPPPPTEPPLLAVFTPWDESPPSHHEFTVDVNANLFLLPCASGRHRRICFSADRRLSVDAP